MNAKEFRNVLYYFCNRWCKGESNLVFNGVDFDPEMWKHSMGDYMWKKWEKKVTAIITSVVLAVSPVLRLHAEDMDQPGQAEPELGRDGRNRANHTEDAGRDPQSRISAPEPETGQHFPAGGRQYPDC